ncbi:unnamed protein product [Acanthosepion pharaonis]|uniref:Reverse transcriptase domain-containing protein n=1 Tax=Acanthosepion pharaonis TaxID=158019 RepID=A0A812BYF4_ACAPH|nr:unnamed protein product [Sepia pharaonis]
MVSKSEAGAWRPCGDFRRLNAQTVPDKYPIPHLQDFAITLQGASIFTKLDLRKAFHQIPVAKDDIHKTAVTTPFGLFEFTRMPFGLRNAAQSFQRLIDEVLRGLHFTFAYIDDVLIASRNIEEHTDRGTERSAFTSKRFVSKTSKLISWKPLSYFSELYHRICILTATKERSAFTSKRFVSKTFKTEKQPFKSILLNCNNFHGEIHLRSNTTKNI